jgi:HK97 family phage prohead protease
MMTEIQTTALETRPQLQSFEIRDAGTREVEGVVATFGDWYDTGPFFESLAPGVFDESLKRSANHIKLIDSHNGGKPVATPVKWIKTDTELRGIFRFGTTEDAKQKYADVKEGLVSSFSVGFNPTKRPGASEWAADGKRVVRNSARLMEVSLVTLPANPDAVVEQIRTMGVPTGLITPRRDEWAIRLEAMRLRS